MVKGILSTGGRLFKKEQSSILSAATVITAASLLSAILGLFRNRLLVARFFGTPLLQQQLDAYWVAFRIPELVFQLLVIGALSAAFIPVYSKYRRKDAEEANTIAVTMMNLVLLVFTALSVIIFIFAEPFNSLITSEQFSAEQVALAAQLTRIMLVAQLFFAVSNFLTGIIQANHRFLIPALSPLAYNLGIIVGIVFLSPMLGIYGPGAGVVLGAFLHLILQLPLAAALGFRYRPLISFNLQGVREILHLMVPRTLAISVSQLELFVSVYFATALSSGSLTIINLAQQLMNAPIRIFSVPIGQASLPFLSKDSAEGNLERFRQTLTDTLKQVLFLAFPAGILLLILRIPLVRLAYGSSTFPWTATILTGKMVAILALSVFAQSAIQLLVRAFYALHNTRLPFITALISVGINIGLSYLSVFIFEWGVLGIGWAMTLASLAQFLMLFILLTREVGGNLAHEFFPSMSKILAASGMMGVGLWVPMRLLDQFVFDTTRTVPLILLTIIVSLIGGSVYLLLTYALKVPELNAFLSLLKKAGQWQKVLKESQEIIEPTSETGEVKSL